MDVTADRARAANWLARTKPADLLYGAIVSATVLGTISIHVSEYEWIALSTFAVVVIYWLAHAYVHAISARYDGDERILLARIGTAGRGASGVLKGGLPAIAVYAAAALLGAADGTATYIALVFSVLLLMAVGYLGAHSTGARGRALVAEVIGAGMFGVIVIVGKGVLH